MKGKYIIRIDKSLYEYTDYDDIPATFDSLIQFLPDYPKPPHTDKQHEMIHGFVDKLKELLKREKNARSN
jgi:hypothetical protein